MISCNTLRKIIYQGYCFLYILKRLLTQCHGHLYMKSWNPLAMVTIISWIKTFNNNVKLSVNRYVNYSLGLKVNFDKTHTVWIGINKYSPVSIKTRCNYHGRKQYTI